MLSLTEFTFDVLRSVVFFYIKTPLRVKEAGLEELIPTTWWPTHFDKEVKQTHLVLLVGSIKNAEMLLWFEVLISVMQSKYKVKYKYPDCIEVQYVST